MTNGVSGLLMFFKNNGGIKAADANGNGVITKQELDNFIQDNGGNNEALEELWNVLNAKIMGSSGTINNYTNLTKEEVAVYEAIEQYTSKLDSKCPQELKSAGWVGEVTSELLSSSFVKSLYTGNDNNSAILANLEKKAKAIETKVTVRLYSKILAENTYKLVTNYNSSADSQLQAILNSYASKCGDKGFDEIREDIQQIVNAYGRTADLANCATGDLSLLAQYGYDVENYAEFLPMNDLQIAVLVKNIGNLTASDLPSGHEKFISFYQDAMTEYVAANTTGKTYADFASLKNSFTKEGFRASDQFKSANGKVSVIIALDLNVEKGTSYTYSFKNVKPEFLERLKATLGDKIATLLTTNASSLSIFNSEILPEIIKKAGEVVDGNLANFMTNGVLDVDKVYDEITTQALDAMEKFLSKGFQGIKLQDLNDVYDGLEEIWVMQADDEATMLHREQTLAKFYCNAVSGLNDKFKQFVNEIFGSIDNIAKMDSVSEIQAHIDDLREKINSFGDLSTFKLDKSSWGELATGATESTPEASNADKNNAQTHINLLLNKFGTNKTSVKNELNDALGNSYVNVIQHCKTVSELEAQTKDIIQKLKKISAKDEYKVNGVDILADVEDDYKASSNTAEILSNNLNMIIGSTNTYTISPKLIDSKVDLSLREVEISCEDPSGLISVKKEDDGTYTVTINGEKAIEDYKASITIKIDGVAISTMNIVLNVHELNAEDIEKDINLDYHKYDTTIDEIENWDNDSTDDAKDDAREDAKQKLKQDTTLRNYIRTQIENVLKHYNKTIYDIPFDSLYNTTVDNMTNEDLPISATGSRHHGFMNLHEQYSATIKYSEAVKNFCTKIKPVLAEAIANAFKPTDISKAVELANLISSVSVSNVVGSATSVHTEFGMNGGDIVFESSDATDLYKRLKNQVHTACAQNMVLVNAIGGEDVLDRLIQAAWIATYDDTFRSSQENDMTSFVTKVLENLTKILNKIRSNPELLQLYKGHTAYADNSLTDNLDNYGSNDPDGIYYDDEIETSNSTGLIILANSDSNKLYQETMSQLLKNIKSKYSYIDESKINYLFLQAQVNAIDIMRYNRGDNPYGTSNGSFLYKENYDTADNAVANTDWAGTSNSGDRGSLPMSAFVQMVLYQFDKLLYQEMMK